MSSGVPQHSRRNDSKIFRGIKALPLVGISAAAIYFMWVVALPGLMVRVGEIMEKGVESQIGIPGFVKPMRNFTNIEFIDGRIRGLAACFASFQFVDVICNWQCFTFLTDIGVVYAVLLFESARRANYMTLAYFPVLLGYNMQFFGIGTLMALYCFVQYIQSSTSNLRSKDLRTTDLGYTASVLPVLILCHLVPNYASLSRFIEPQTRHMWNWIWQPVPLYISLAQILAKYTIMPIVSKGQSSNPNGDLRTITYTIYSLCTLSSATWLYVLFSAPYSWSTLFIPNLAPGQTGDAYIRMFLQFDEICSEGAMLVWLLYHYSDLKSVGLMKDSWVAILLKGTVCLVLLGPGTTVGLGWLYREQLWANQKDGGKLQ